MVCSDDWAHMYFQRQEIKRASDVDNEHDAKCWRELSLQLLWRGVLVGRGFMWNASMVEDDIDAVTEAVVAGLHALHQVGWCR